MTDGITFAHPVDSRVTLAKIIKVEGDRIIGKEPSPNVRNFRYVELPVHDLRTLYIAVRRAAATGAIAVRARPRGRSATVASIRPTASSLTSRSSLAAGSGSIGTACRSKCSPARTHPGSGIPTRCSSPGSALGSRCGACRQPSVTCRASGRSAAGAGFNAGFRLRTWHWLNHPVTGAEIKTWLHPAIERGLVDPVTLVECQPHYLGVHVQGGTIPARAASASCALARQEVQVPDIRRHQAPPGSSSSARKRPPEQRQRAARSRAGQRLRPAAHRRLPRRHPRRTARHTTYKEQAARARAICEHYGLDWQPIRRALIAAYESALTPAEAHERRSFSTEGVLDWLEARTPA